MVCKNLCLGDSDTTGCFAAFPLKRDFKNSDQFTSYSLLRRQLSNGAVRTVSDMSGGLQSHKACITSMSWSPLETFHLRCERISAILSWKHPRRKRDTRCSVSNTRVLVSGQPRRWNQDPSCRVRTALGFTWKTVGCETDWFILVYSGF